MNRSKSPEVKSYLRKAAHALEVARKLDHEGYYSDAASKTYYAMFYAAQALLRAHGIEVVRHSAVESALGSHFAKSGKLEPRFHRLLINARRAREVADYDIDEELVTKDSTTTIENGEEFVKEMVRLVYCTPASEDRAK